MPETLHLRRQAMATHFELWLVGEDREHLEAVGQAALAEVVRLDGLLSRFDRRAEIARVNREAPHGAVLVDLELFDVLRECRRWWDRTDGYFDVRLFAERVGGGARPGFEASIELDEAIRTVRFTDSSFSLDLGGFGKGYALDAAARIVRNFGVRSALMHGGTSSAIAMGERSESEPWTLKIRNPFGQDRGEAISEIELRDSGYSHSAVHGERAGASDIIDPFSGEPLSEQAACFVITPSAVDAEVCSTAMLSMGRSRASRFLHSPHGPTPPTRAAWIDAGGPDVAIHWFQTENGVLR
jgi:FAD:protein FMN transferase